MKQNWGYVDDEETELYYLRSRYYVPKRYRFVNSDVVIATGNLYSYCDNSPISYIDVFGFSKDSVKGFHASGTKFWYYAIHYNHGKPVPGGGYVPHIHLYNSKTRIEYAINADNTPHDSDRCKYPDNSAMEVLKKDPQISKKWPPSDWTDNSGTGNSNTSTVSKGETIGAEQAFNLIAVGVIAQSQNLSSISTCSPYSYSGGMYSFGYGTPQYTTSAGSTLQSAYGRVEFAVTGFLGYLDDKITECCLNDMGVPVF